MFIIALGIGIQFKYLNEFPAFIHAWAQDDRYALAIGFLDNGFDLFHPETMIYSNNFLEIGKLHTTQQSQPLISLYTNTLSHY